MTADDAIAKARIVAGDHRWQWREPIYAVQRQRGLLGLGPTYWEVTSNAYDNGENVRVEIDDRTAQMLRATFIPANTPGPAITELRALEIARDVAGKEGWPWLEPIRVTRSSPTLEGVKPWWVWSNARSLGMNVSVAIHPETGVVLRSGFAPR